MKSERSEFCGWLKPHRSVRCRPTTSSSRRLVMGEVHSACSSRCVGERKKPAASGERVAVTPVVPGPPGQLQRDCWSQVNENLCFGASCVVNRTCASAQLFKFAAG